jgi:predicted type IV restriction endonuclease
MRLTCKDKLEWNVEADQPFQDLKIAFTTTPILIHPNFSNPCFLENDASNYVLGVVLSQKKKGQTTSPYYI